MFDLLNIEYNDWKMLSIDWVAKAVAVGDITADQYKQITGQDYIAPQPTAPAQPTQPTATTPAK